MLTFPPYPIPVVTELGEGYLIYVESSGTWDNDVWCICLCNGGDVKHFLSNQVKIFKNATFDIKEKK